MKKIEIIRTQIKPSKRDKRIFSTIRIFLALFSVPIFIFFHFYKIFSTIPYNYKVVEDYFAKIFRVEYFLLNLFPHLFVRKKPNDKN